MYIENKWDVTGLYYWLLLLFYVCLLFCIPFRVKADPRTQESRRFGAASSLTPTGTSPKLLCEGLLSPSQPAGEARLLTAWGRRWPPDNTTKNAPEGPGPPDGGPARRSAPTTSPDLSSPPPATNCCLLSPLLAQGFCSEMLHTKDWANQQSFTQILTLHLFTRTAERPTGYPACYSLLVRYKKRKRKKKKKLTEAPPRLCESRGEGPECQNAVTLSPPWFLGCQQPTWGMERSAGNLEQPVSRWVLNPVLQRAKPQRHAPSGTQQVKACAPA